MRIVGVCRCLLNRRHWESANGLFVLSLPQSPQVKSKSNQHGTGAQARSKCFFFPLWISLFLVPPLNLLAEKDEKTKDRPPNTEGLWENKFPHACPFRPTDDLKERSLVEPGNEWLVKTYGVFTCGPLLRHCLPRSSPLPHVTLVTHHAGK